MQELIETLERDAEARSDAILEEARVEAERILAAADANVDRRLRDRLAARARERGREADARVAAGRHAAAARVLEARARVLDAVFECAAARLSDLPANPAYPAAAGALLERALSFLPPGAVEVACDPATARAIRDAAARFGAHVAARADAPTGFAARSADGAVVVDGTLRGLLDRRRPTLAMEVTAMLESGP